VLNVPLNINQPTTDVSIESQERRVGDESLSQNKPNKAHAWTGLYIAVDISADLLVSCPHATIPL